MTAQPSSMPRVLLVHGIWNAKSWLTPLARRLRHEGFEVETFGYPSILGGPEPAIAALIARLQGGPPVHLVGHSLGGLIGLEALRRAPGLPVQR
ncbi:MAG TPA: alpha/beta hydrolase, partial [Pseudoxanthomonas mexicana]|nr:alpha/beta hydrolase [Pseudoxanthomonas mexicana]